MHRATPANSSFRAYSSGGSRATINKVDDSTLMQESSAGMMKNESRKGIEAPQNYGFTSVAHGRKEGENYGAEMVVNYLGGNRSFPVGGNMDDRRHRLKGLSEGDTAMFRGKDDSQQFHMTGDGGFWSAPTSKTVRMQLVPDGSSAASGSQGQGQQQQPQATQQAANGGGGGGGDGQQQQSSEKKPTGQQAVAGAGSDSKDFMHLKSDEARISSGKKVRLSTSKDDDDVLHEATDQKDYCGGTPAKHKFGIVLTLAGPSKNVYGRLPD
jgi:phage gp45-like